MIIRGRVWVFGDDINTDLMYPGFVVSLPEEERPKYCMHANRPGWAQQVKKGDILVAGRNFGCGSSRPAAKSLKELGISCVLAESINGLFLRNAVNFGLPALTLPGVTKMFKEGEIAEVDISSGEVKNVNSGESRRVKPLPEQLIKIIEAGGLLPLLAKEGFLKL